MHAIEALVQQVNGASFIAIDTCTEPVLRGGRANPMLGRIRKITIGNVVMVFQNKHTNAYDNMVKKRLEQEGKDPASFVLSARSWGTRVPNAPIVEHKGEQYLEVIFLKPGAVSYELDGVAIAKEDIEGLYEPIEAQQGGLTNKVFIRTFKFDSVTALTIGKQKYDLSI